MVNARLPHRPPPPHKRCGTPILSQEFKRKLRGPAALALPRPSTSCRHSTRRERARLDDCYWRPRRRGGRRELVGSGHGWQCW